MTKAVVQAQATAGADLVAAYRQAFDAYRARHKLPAQLDERARKAFEAFAAAGIPHPKLEAWRRTDLGSLRARHHALAAAARTDEAQVAPWRHDAAAEIVLVDGVFAPALSKLGKQQGLSVRPLAEAAADKAVAEALGQLADVAAPERALWALNTAFLGDGAVIQVAKDAQIDGLVHVLHLSSGSAGTVRHPRALVLAAEGASATVVETFAALAGGAAWTNALTEVRVARAASLSHVRLVHEPTDAIHTGALAADVHRDATYRALSFAIGAGRSRHDLTVRLVEQGATAVLNGVFLAAGEQHVDQNTFIDHVEPHGTSREDFKGILAGSAHGVFTGNILVRKGAQKTSSEQENRNLLLSRKALVDTTPQLEIHADDVKCSHGSTIGRLDEKQRFYLRARGIPDAEAKRILTVAFAQRPLEVVPDVKLREHLTALVSQWFTENATDGGA